MTLVRVVIVVVGSVTHHYRCHGVGGEPYEAHRYKFLESLKLRPKLHFSTISGYLEKLALVDQHVRKITLKMLQC